jgi:NADH:ubiquinone oxidoreductase subunit 5 (subunit L)/multisubunit Na+/H+ antiporter MnhA subunit
MLVNRVGDVGLMLGICCVFLSFKTVDYAVLFALEPMVLDKKISFLSMDFSVNFIISLLLF